MCLSGQSDLPRIVYPRDHARSVKDKERAVDGELLCGSVRTRTGRSRCARLAATDNRARRHILCAPGTTRVTDVVVVATRPKRNEKFFIFFFYISKKIYNSAIRNTISIRVNK